jgi:uncharacterized protein
MSRTFALLGWYILGFPFLAMSCTVLPAQKDTSQFFILTSSSEPASSDSVNRSSRHELTIGLGPIDFPGYLKRRDIVTRLEGGQLELSDNKRWAESLDSNFQRVLSQDLGLHLRTQGIVLFPWYGRQQLDFQVEVQVQRFETDSAGHSHLQARWIIKDPRTGRELLARESNISSAVQPGDVAGSQALSSDVNTLSSSIAQSLIGLSESAGMARRASQLVGGET